MRLRLPEDALLEALVSNLEQKMNQLTPKEVALVAWALARADVSCDS